MDDSDYISEEELELFRQAMKKVTPLAKKKSIQSSRLRKKPALSTQSQPTSPHKISQKVQTIKKPTLPTLPKKQPHHFKKIESKHFFHHKSKTLSFIDHVENDVKSEEIISFFRSGVPYREQIKLKRGHCKLGARLDLHQLNVDQALIQCEQFLAECHAKRIRYALIIHGKAKNIPTPILKNALNRWLRIQPSVLAFHSAKPHDGGTGALYLIISHSPLRITAK
jgi:DNA-nicking Smr family endonuclease